MKMGQTTIWRKYPYSFRSYFMETNRGLGPIIIVVIFLVVLLSGGYLFARKAGYFPETAPSDIVQPMQDSTADWKTYQNKEYGFEFRYPAGWFLDTSSSGGDITLTSYNPTTKGGDGPLGTDSMQLRVFIYPKGQFTSLDDWFSRLSVDVPKEKVLIDGEKGVKTIGEYDKQFGTGNNQNNNIRLFHDFIAYQIHFRPSDSVFSEDFKKIISTFRFTK